MDPWQPARAKERRRLAWLTSCELLLDESSLDPSFLVSFDLLCDVVIPAAVNTVPCTLSSQGFVSHSRRFLETQISFVRSVQCRKSATLVARSPGSPESG